MEGKPDPQGAQGGEAMETNAFGSLAIWREKLSSDLGDLSSTAGRPNNKLRLLLEQGKDVEQAVLGCLKDSLWELREGVEWGLLDEGFAGQQRQQLYNHACKELVDCKQLCLQLAREAGVLQDYCAAVKKQINHTVSDYDSIGSLKFGLAVWRANLQLDISLAADAKELEALLRDGYYDAKELEALLRDGYYDALRLIQRCCCRSLHYWSAQQKHGAPTAEALHAVDRNAVDRNAERVQHALLEVAAQHDCHPGPLQALFAKVSDPSAVRAAE